MSPLSWWCYDRKSLGECHLIPGVSPCVSTQERPSQIWIVSFQRLSCTSCLNTITFSPCIHLTHTHTHMHTHLISCICFVFGEGALSHFCSPYLSKLDAGSGCLTASVKLWCGCLILGSMHLKVFIIIIFKKVEETSWMEASGSAVHLGETRPLACWRWMESPGQGFKVPRFPIPHSRGMVLPDEWSLLGRGS